MGIPHYEVLKRLMEIRRTTGYDFALEEWTV